MHIMSAAELAAAFKDAAPAHSYRRVERTVTLHEDDGGTTAAVLATHHNKESKQLISNIRIVRKEKREGPFAVTTWIPYERTHNRRLPSTPVARYSDKALAAADTDALALLEAEPDWLDNLDLGPYKGSL